LGQAAGGLLPPGTIVDGQGVTSDKYQQDNSSWALFTHNTWHATDRLDVTLGVRYTDEDKDLSSTLIASNPACLRIAGFGPPLPLTPGGIGQQLICNPLINPTVDGIYDGSVTNSEWSGTFNVAYDLAEGLLGYVSYGRGYKAGGFNLDRGGLDNPLLGQVPDVTDLEFEPETADTYELGLKSTLLDGNLVVNSVYFYSIFDDFQLNTFTGTNFIVENIDSVTSKGVEVEAQATPMEQLTLAGGVTYTDATYDDPNSSLDGRRLTNAPYWVITTSATWEQPVTGSLDGFLNVGYRFQSDTNTGSDLAPEKQQGSFAVVNGSIGVNTTDGAWRFELWGRNILDRDYKQVAFGAPLQTGTFGEWLGDPRMWGATIRHNF
jgi:outer membrane receptor protein involved in Fe transport